MTERSDAVQRASFGKHLLTNKPIRCASCKADAEIQIMFHDRPINICVACFDAHVERGNTIDMAPCDVCLNRVPTSGAFWVCDDHVEKTEAKLRLDEERVVH